MNCGHYCVIYLENTSVGTFIGTNIPCGSCFRKLRKTNDIWSWFASVNSAPTFALLELNRCRGALHRMECRWVGTGRIRKEASVFQDLETACS